MKRTLLAAPVAALSLALVAALAYAHPGDGEHSHDGDSAAKAQVGQPAPDFTLMDQDGKPVSLADHKGKVVVIEQFNDQCPFVVKFYKNGDMNRLADEAEGMDVVWLAVDSSNFTSVEENKAISEEWSIDRPLLDDSDGTVGKSYGAKTTPHMFVIDAEGVLRYAGAIDSIPSTDSSDIEKADNYVMAAVEAVKAGETPSPAETKPYGCSVKY